jgi:hypothetical protein
MDAARTMMQAGAAVVRAGGAGVFIDNSTLAPRSQASLPRRLRPARGAATGSR